jgi:hypothetical protein
MFQCTASSSGSFLSLYCAEGIKVIKVTNAIKSLDDNVHVIIADDKIKCIKGCELTYSVGQSPT